MIFSKKAHLKVSLEKRAHYQKTLGGTRSEVFKIIVSTGDINIFDDGGSISVLYFQIKSSFSCEKRHPLWNLKQNFVDKLIKINPF